VTESPDPTEPTATTDPLEVPIEELTAEAFAPFGTVIPPRDHTAQFGPGDAQLELGHGTPRFYTMRLDDRPTTGGVFTVTHITHHRRVTQALASAGGVDWVLAVAPPVDLTRPVDPASPAGGPTLDDIRAFTIPGDTAVMLHAGTWHAGPLFEGPGQAFFNLELSDTNIVDHHTCDLVATYGRSLQLR
jgi:ureidoglycolate hydrolase